MRQGTATGSSSKTPLRMLRQASNLQRAPGVELQLAATPGLVTLHRFHTHANLPWLPTGHSKGMVTLPRKAAQGQVIP